MSTQSLQGGCFGPSYEVGMFFGRPYRKGPISDPKYLIAYLFRPMMRHNTEQRVTREEVSTVQWQEKLFNRNMIVVV